MCVCVCVCVCVRIRVLVIPYLAYMLKTKNSER